MIKLYLLVVVVGLVGGVVYGGYYYYKDTQSRIQTLTENNAKIMAAKEAQDNTIKTLIADEGKKDVKAVVVHVTEAPSITVLGNRIVCHRLSGTIVDEVKTADKITTVTSKPPHGMRELLKLLTMPQKHHHQQHQ